MTNLDKWFDGLSLEDRLKVQKFVLLLYQQGELWEK